MRVLIVTNLYPSRWQPHRAEFNRQQFAALAAWHQVRLIAPVAWTKQWRQPAEHEGQLLLRDGLTVEHPCYVYPPKVLRSWHGRFFLSSIKSSFERAVEEFRPEVVLASWAYPDAWAAMKLTQAAGLPLVVKVHGSDLLLMANDGERRRQTIEAITGADAVIAVSRQLAGRAAELGVDPARLNVVYNGVDTELFQPGSADVAREKLKLSSEPLVLFVGNLAPVKSLDTLISACSLLRDRNLRFQCRLIGHGALRRDLTRQIQSARLTKFVQLHGPCHLHQLPDWYRAANVLVLPSVSEGVPNVILEAQACGTPVVASRVGGIPEILDDSCLVPAKDPIALADAIERTLNCPNVVRRPLTSWTQSAAHLAGILSEVAQSTLVQRAAA